MAAWEQWLCTAPLRVRSLFRRREMDRDLQEEFQYHLDRKAEELVAAGTPPAEARRVALVAMEGLEQAKEKCRDEWGVRCVEELAQDIRYGARLLRKAPIFTSSAVLMLGIAIGATAVVLSLLDAVLLRPFLYRDAQDLVVISQRFTKQNLEEVPFSAAEVEDFRSVAKSLEDVAAFRHTEFNVVQGGLAERVIGAAVSPNLFELIGVAPIIGRAFIAADVDRDVPVVLISEALWRRCFASDPTMKGKQLLLSGRPHTVIGIMPAQFCFPLPRFNVRGPVPGTAEIWTLTRISENEMSQRSSRSFNVVGRLAGGSTSGRLEADLNRIGDNWTRRFPQVYGGKGFALVAQPLREAVVGRIKPALWILTAAVAAVLLVAVFNLTAILLARGIVREGEFALRIALGAGRVRLVRQLITEGLLLASLSVALGIGLAASVLPALRSTALQVIPLVTDARISGSVLLCTAAIALASGLCFGIVPAFSLPVRSPAAALRNRDRTSARARRWAWVRDVLVIAEIALGLVLLVCAGSLTQSVARLRGVNLGFNSANVLTLETSLPVLKYPDDKAVAGYFSAAVTRVRTIPGVKAAAFASVLPLSGVNQDSSFTIEGESIDCGISPDEEFRVVTPGYFDVLEIPVRRGRSFTEADNLAAPSVVIINDALAYRYWRDGDALGKRISPNNSPDRSMEIVGIVGNVKHRAIDEPERPEFYLPHAQLPTRLMTMTVKTEGSPADTVAAIRAQLEAIDPEQPVARVRMFDEVIANSIAPYRLAAAFVGIFAVIALVLGTVGIYSVMAYHFAERKSEIAVRVALGAERHHIVRLILRRSLGLLGLGTLIGSVVVVGATRPLLVFFHGPQQLDARTFGTALLALLIVGLGAAFAPALRATRANSSLARNAC